MHYVIKIRGDNFVVFQGSAIQLVLSLAIVQLQQQLKRKGEGEKRVQIFIFFICFIQI